MRVGGGGGGFDGSEDGGGGGGGGEGWDLGERGRMDVCFGVGFVFCVCVCCDGEFVGYW